MEAAWAKKREMVAVRCERVAGGMLWADERMEVAFSAVVVGAAVGSVEGGGGSSVGFCREELPEARGLGFPLAADVALKEVFGCEEDGADDCDPQGFGAEAAEAGGVEGEGFGDFVVGGRVGGDG